MPLMGRAQLSILLVLVLLLAAVLAFAWRTGRSLHWTGMFVVSAICVSFVAVFLHGSYRDAVSQWLDLGHATHAPIETYSSNPEFPEEEIRQ